MNFKFPIHVLLEVPHVICASPLVVTKEETLTLRMTPTAKYLHKPAVVVYTTYVRRGPHYYGLQLRDDFLKLLEEERARCKDTKLILLLIDVMAC
eukprot:TRINITY_DN2292_c0_g1_i1.p1 TRINITY_DN2292_c0_g1~~TRINITY_DN2292_c0_g1_i1.p1  ORF type:complete len:95 (+),score=7.73 TRINITY_DN2292_c0_g1_i1:76-360(+)